VLVKNNRNPIPFHLETGGDTFLLDDLGGSSKKGRNQVAKNRLVKIGRSHKGGSVSFLAKRFLFLKDYHSYPINL
jgi:hypothetical protein